MIQALEQYSIEDLLAALAVKQNAAPNAANEHEQQQANHVQQVQTWGRLANRPGINLPTPENLQRVADDAAVKRFVESKAHNVSPEALGRSWGVSREFVLFVQRLEATVIEQGREIEWLKSQSYGTTGPHMRDVERRG